jgi:dipeptidyl aminopeptidase/acylaminoacyl peptidase
MPKLEQLTPEDLFRLQFIDAAMLSPDGTRVVYQVRTIDREKDKYRSHLWMVPASGGEPRQLTHGEGKNTGAAWSPDGKWIAFVSDRKDKKAQIYRLPLDGGEAERLTDLDGQIGGIAWSPDGTTPRPTKRTSPRRPTATSRTCGTSSTARATSRRGALTFTCSRSRGAR